MSPPQITTTHHDAELAAHWRATGAWLDQLVGDVVPGVFDPDDVVIVDGAKRLTFGDLDRAVDRVARRFVADGIVPGAVIAMQLPNWWEAVVVSHAAFRIGAILNPLLPALRANELALIFAESRPSAIVIPARFREVEGADTRFGLGSEHLPSRPRASSDTLRGRAFLGGRRGTRTLDLSDVNRAL